MSRRGGLFQLGPALRLLRQRRGLKQYQVAERAGIARSTLSAYERGRVRPSLETLERILSAVGGDLGKLSRALKLVAAESPPAVGEQLTPGLAASRSLDHRRA